MTSTPDVRESTCMSTPCASMSAKRSSATSGRRRDHSSNHRSWSGMTSRESGGVTPGTENASSIAITRNTGTDSACETIAFPIATTLTVSTDLRMKLRRLSLLGCCSLMVALSLNMFMSCQSEYDGGSANITTKIAKRQKTQKKQGSRGLVEPHDFCSGEVPARVRAYTPL